MSRGRQAGRRPRPTRTELTRILVVTEGEQTEPEYVELLNQSRAAWGKGQAWAKTVGVGKDPLRVVEAAVLEKSVAEKKGKPYDHYVALVDVDDHTTHIPAFQLGKRESIEVLVTNLKFEVWLRWHAEGKRSVMDSKQLDRHCEKLKVVKDKKLPSKFPIENVGDAYRTAKLADPGLGSGMLGKNPSSAMTVLLDLMGFDAG